MTDDPIDGALRDHYRGQTPSRPMVDRLRDATLAADRARRRSRTLSLALAAVASLAIILGFAVLRSSDDDLAGRVAAEVALNHAKDLALDVRATRYGTVAAAMDKLDFALAVPPARRIGDFELAGGRYCSIQGQLAAQLRLEGPGGRHATLYQTRLEPPLADLGERTLQADGVTVTLWSSNGIFFALARADRDLLVPQLPRG